MAFEEELADAATWEDAHKGKRNKRKGKSVELNERTGSHTRKDEAKMEGQARIYEH